MLRARRQSHKIRTGACFLIRLYSFIISPLTGPCCRFHPTCSSYARQSISAHGLLKGIILAARRIFRCHPYYRGNWDDPVPNRFTWRDVFGYKREHGNKKRPEYQ